VSFDMNKTRAITAVLAALWLLSAAPAAQAQTADDLFDRLTVQEIRLFINSRDLRDLRARYREDIYYTADLQWRNIRVRNAAVRSRGQASRNDRKLALRVDFNRYTTGQTFLGLKSIVLKNLWQDGSMMHEMLAMSMFARLGQPASRESFCRLFINNEYQGLYTIVESVDDKYLDRTVGEHAGYLFSYQFMGQYYGSYLGDDFRAYRRILEPQSHELEANSVLYGPIHDLFREVSQPFDAVWRERVEQHVDLAQFVTQAAIENFLAEEDGLLGFNGMNNFYLYRPAGSKRHRFFPWDKDSAFLLPQFSILTRADQNDLFRQAMTFADLRELYLQTLETAARSAAEEGWLETEIARIADLVAPAVQQDTRKSFSTENFFESVEAMKEFARIRPTFVLEEVAKVRRGQ
jgi:spore coat protein CotH